MAKLRGPAFSLFAQGKFTKDFSFTNWKGISKLRRSTTPRNPQTDHQQFHRDLLSWAVLSWQSLDDGEKQDYNDSVKNLNLKMSGYNYYLQDYIANFGISVFSATGGIITDSGGFRYHVFLSDGTFTVSGSSDVEILIVAGGGGGGMGSGGGGGGLLYYPSYSVTDGPYSVVVGLGGQGRPFMFTNPQSPYQGNPSSFGPLSTLGGGAGAGAENNGFPGGSGGGGGYKASGTTGGGAGYVGQGKDATGNCGSTADPYVGGAGGGAGVSASCPVGTTPAKGGDGLEFPQFAVVAGYPSGWFSGGGGATTYHTVTFGAGGAGGGGNGGQGVNGSPGVANSGGGGGGAGENLNGGAGGKGIVIVRYPI